MKEYKITLHGSEDDTEVFVFLSGLVFREFKRVSELTAERSGKWAPFMKIEEKTL